MEELYMIEFYVTQISLEHLTQAKTNNGDKKVTVFIEFGKLASFTVRQGEFDEDLQTTRKSSEQMEPSIITEANPSSVNLVIDSKDSIYSSSKVNTGASFLFANSPESLKQNLKYSPLKISIWTNDESDETECVGLATIIWDSIFYDLVDKSSHGCEYTLPMLVKTSEKVRSEVTGSLIGEITMIIRMTALGRSVMTRFKEVNQGFGFIFRNRSLNASHKCKKYGVDTKPEHLKPIGIIYESIEIKDPDEVKAEDRKNRASTELKQAGLDQECVMFITGDKNRVCETKTDGGISLPCGNANCKLTQMVKAYLMRQPTPSVGGGGATMDVTCDCTTMPSDKHECGPSFSEQFQNFQMCEICGGISHTGRTCKDLEVTANKDCPAPCNTHNNDKIDDSRVQKMLYDGLSRMLMNNKLAAGTGPNQKQSMCRKSRT